MWRRLRRQLDDLGDLPHYAPYIFVVALLVADWRGLINDHKTAGLVMLGWIGVWMVADRIGTVIALGTAFYVILRCLQLAASIAI